MHVGLGVGSVDARSSAFLSTASRRRALSNALPAWCTSRTTRLVSPHAALATVGSGVPGADHGARVLARSYPRGVERACVGPRRARARAIHDRSDRAADAPTAAERVLAFVSEHRDLVADRELAQRVANAEEPARADRTVVGRMRPVRRMRTSRSRGRGRGRLRAPLLWLLLAENNDSVSEAARTAGVNRTSRHRLLRRHGLRG